MSIVRQRARIVRVRRISHNLAALAAAKAHGHVQTLEISRERLKLMGGALGSEPGVSSGAALASRGELAMRLQGAARDIGHSIESARAAAALREQARLGARRDQESAEKLERKAASAAAQAAERRTSTVFRPRRTSSFEGE